MKKIIILIVVILIVVAGGFYYWNTTQKGSEDVSIKGAPTTESPQDNTIVTQKQPSISIISPTKNTVLEKGSGIAPSIIEWSSTNLKDSLINIDLIDYEGRQEIVAHNVKNSGKYSWVIPETVGGDYKIKIYAAGANPPVEDISTYYFKIVEAPAHANPRISVGWPVGGETLKFGETYTIKWEAKNMELENISVSFRTPDGTTCLFGTVPASRGFFTVTLSSNYACPGLDWHLEPNRQYQVYLYDPAALYYTPIGRSPYFTIVQ